MEDVDVYGKDNEEAAGEVSESVAPPQDDSEESGS